MTPAVKLVPDVGPADVNKVLGTGLTGVPQWIPLVDHEAPPGGTTGQVLAKATAADRDVVWRDETTELPPIVGPGTTGQVLTVTPGGGLEWKTPPVPTATTSFKGTVADVGSLPSTATPGDVYVTQTDGHLHVATTSGPPASWSDIGPSAGNTLPAPGTNGQVLQVVGGQVTWQDPVDKVIPDGGATGQIVAKVDGTDGNVQWIDPPISLPAGGTPGQTLSKVTAAAGDAQWVTPPSSLPTFGTPQAGQVLMVNPQGQVGWVTPPATGSATAFKGTVADIHSLPTANVAVGDVWVTLDDGHLHVAITGSTPGPAAFSSIGPAAGGTMPTAGPLNNGQVLMVVGNAPTWVAPPRELPPVNGKTAGDALVVVDPTTGAIDWQTAAGGGGAGLPVGGTAGQVLGYGPNGQLAWINPPARQVPLQPGQTPTGGTAALPPTWRRSGSRTRRAPPTNTDGKNGDHWITTSGQHYTKDERRVDVAGSGQRKVDFGRLMSGAVDDTVSLPSGTDQTRVFFDHSTRHSLWTA